MLGLALAGARAEAHQTSVKYVEVTVDGVNAAITVRVAPGDVTEPMKLPPDARPSAADAAADPAVAAYVRAWIAVTAAGAACPPSPGRALPDDDGRFVAVEWRVTCPEPIAELALDFTHLFSVDRTQLAIVQLHGSDTAVSVAAGDPPLVLHAGEAPTGSLLSWIRIGMDHIYGGRDHICFVLALLIAVVLERAPDRTWRVRTTWSALRATAKIVTAFTVAHSLTLIAAALGYVHAPSRVVESLIAVSIAYTAVENIVEPAVPWRHWLTFAFGLVHGLGFASVLAELLPPHGVVPPLLCFNVGVELGQLTIVLVALPLLLIAARTLGATRYRRIALPALSSVIFILGAIWIIERVAGVGILGM